MPAHSYALALLSQEARALLTRLALVKPFALQESMVPAAALLPAAQIAIETYLITGRRRLRDLVLDFLGWLRSEDARAANVAEAQRRFTLLRLQFNTVLTQFDMFHAVLTQRSESETGVWLSGLDVVSADALELPGGYYEPPPVVCYLDRGVGAAIRRARTRLPGGGQNPVAIVRVPRERMVGSGIASSLVHEVGHQAAALLDLVPSLRPVLRQRRQTEPDATAWGLWDRWISEIVADFWSVARVGVASTLGLIGVVSLPQVFVFRMNLDDPHPMPWIRVKLSSAMGNALYPHPQWRRLNEVWESYYPRDNLDLATRRLIAQLEAAMAGFVSLLIHHRPPSLRGYSLIEVLDVQSRQPARLSSLFQRWQVAPQLMYRAAPSLAFATLGQARSDGLLSPEDESVILTKLLNQWALRATLDMSGACAAAARTPLPSLARPPALMY